MNQDTRLCHRWVHQDDFLDILNETDLPFTSGDNKPVLTFFPIFFLVTKSNVIGCIWLVLNNK